ncbi:MAG: hypothetical protein KKH67_00280 [candidate division Zixibacteria bacterium]|nr:hypothetical protein [candidate division Zixibacteria bacterium]MBU1471786.1 hypothetical protein [candidate division Zixibacteria bacterium]
MTRYFKTTFVLAIALICSHTSAIQAQHYFGKNKIQYSQLDWRVLETDHFNIYYYRGEDELARIAAFSIERSYRVLEDKFKCPLDDRVPVIVYSSPNYFGQTNVIPQILPENVAGFTEYFKGRVVVPYDGSYFLFDRVLRHELVHVFTFKKITQVCQDHKKLKLHSPPLWFTEGIAEYWSGEWNSTADMIASDAILSGQVYDENSIYSISGTFLMYKFGESLLQYMAETHGEEKILMIFEDWWKGSTFREVVEYTLGVPLSEVFKGWQYSLKKKYFPVYAEAESPEMIARVLTPEGFSVRPELMRLEMDGKEEREYLIYKANKLGYSGIYIKDAAGPLRKSTTLVKGERSPKFESLYLLDSDISVNKNGELVFASRHYESDVLYLYDLESREIKKCLDFQDIVAIQSPAWSRDCSQIVFTACGMDGEYDLCLYNLAEDTLKQLTNDVYSDIDPIFSPDGRDVLFSSDRTDGGNKGYHNLFRVNIESGKLEQLTWGRCRDGTPSYSPDGSWIVFRSDRDGLPNVYVLDTLGKMFHASKLMAGIQDPSFTPSGDSVVFSAYHKGNIRIYCAEFSDSMLIPVENEPVQYSSWEPEALPGESVRASFDYTNEFSFDIAQSAVAYDAFYGPLGGFQVSLSDMLGNHQYYFLLYNTATTRSDFLSSFNVGLTYINRTRRVNYGGGLFHLYDEYYNRIDGDYDERQFGGLALVTYPISKFRRLELLSVLRKSERYMFPYDSTRHAILSSTFLSYVKDNSLWDISGPIDGTRYNLTVGLALDFRTGNNFSRIGMADLRKYFRLGRRSAFASRLFGYTSTGQEPQRLYLGGSWSLRGYNRRTFYGRNVFLWSNELRFPLIDNLFIGFPLGRVGFSGIRGTIFYDTGNAWDDDFDRFYGSFGFGARVALGYLAVLRFDLARTTDYVKISNAWKFDFFFGWNF